MADSNGSGWIQSDWVTRMDRDESGVIGQILGKREHIAAALVRGEERGSTGGRSDQRVTLLLVPGHILPCTALLFF